jgi:putative membrane protein
MGLISQLLIGFVALLHFYILVLEMFLWTSPKGRKVFGLTEEFAEQSKVLAANQGLYNGFLAAGLSWALLQGSSGTATAIFFLSCVLVAGVYGGITAKPKILFIQAMPAAVSLLAIWFGI